MTTESTRHWGQLRKTLWVLLRHRLDLLIPHQQLPRGGVRFILHVLAIALPTPKKMGGERLREACVELGPVYIKLGQLLSTRRDLIPAAIADELAQLQDRVPPIENFDVVQFVEQVLEQPWGSVFEHLDPQPLASASIAQVHSGTLTTGEDIVIKLVRPGIRHRIEADMALLKSLAKRLTRILPNTERLHLHRIAADHEQVLLSELSMFSEARNQIQLRRNFAESDLLYVPRVFPQHSRENLLVMERVYGIPINQIDELDARGVDLKVLAHKGVETFFKQVFEHNFFHADMHPGNILIDVRNPADPSYIALDCAIIGSLTTADQNYLAQNLLAFFERDYQRVVDLHLDSGWVPPGTDAEAFEAVIRDLCEPIFAKPLADISFADFVVELLQAAGQFNLEIQPQLVLLQKTLLYIEGLGRQLYPQLDLWETAQPFMEHWAMQNLGPAAALNEWLEAGPTLWQKLSHLPSTLHTHQRDLTLVKAELTTQQNALKHLQKQTLKRRRRRRVSRVLGLSLLSLGIWALWQPITKYFDGGDPSLIAAVLSVFVGTYLITRA